MVWIIKQTAKQMHNAKQMKNAKQMQNAKQLQNAKHMQNRMKSHLLDLFCILRFAPQKSYKNVFKQNLYIILSKCKMDARCKTNAKQI